MGTLSVCLVLVLVHLSRSFCSSVPPAYSHHLCLPNQRDALLHFKNSVSVTDDCDPFYDFYPKTDSWNKSFDCCLWEGVKCDDLTGHVIGIDLSSSCLNGSLLANSSLFHLLNLQWLDLSSNFLKGSLQDNTSSLFHMNQLRRLNLADNKFDGDISSDLFTEMVSLTHLNLSHNGFFGLIPYEISLLSSLVSLDLSASNLRFDGQGFGMLATNLTKLANLVLYQVDMSDVSVTSFLNLTSSLQHLSLGECELRGEFPTQVFQLPNIKRLDLNENENLTGYLPNTNSSSALELLDLSHTGFRGSIPDVFGNLTKLTSLSLSSCNFSGPLPITLFNLTQLTHLDLSNNHLEGPLPNHVTELQLMEELRLSNNSISGGVPSWFFTLPSLKYLYLSYNKLAGPIDRIQKPSPVHVIDLSFNDIHGPLPDSISYLVNLSYLDLSSNKLSGSLPDSVFDLVNLAYLGLSSNNLRGVVKPEMLSKLTILFALDISNNSLLSLSTSGNIDVNYSFPLLRNVFFSGCSVRQFPSFFRTSKLEVLDLSNNKITGGISKWEAQGWENLQVLKISNNYLDSLEQIPGKKLVFLDLNSNLLQGTILDLLIPTLPSLDLEVFLISDNNLTGNIPSSICNWTSLTVLDLSKNSLIGTIPECIGNFSYSIAIIDLQMNNLYGKIPDSFVNNLYYLSHLFLNDNQLEGLVPKSLANSTSLELLNLGNNKLSDRFPHWLASLPSLQVLILKSNRFHGSLPHSIASSNFSALRILDLSGNDFSGTLPTALFQNLKAMTMSYKMKKTQSDDDYYQISVNVTTKGLELQLTKIAAIFVSMDLSNNQFCGQIPEQVGQLISLHMLNFSRNNFTGPIPASFGNLVQLESLDLSSNNLGGRIPYEMTKLTFLEVLNLSENHLVGPIPHGTQFDTFENDSYIGGNMGLCGFPLSKQCDYRGGVQPPAAFVGDHEGSALPFFWKAVMMGYGSGVVLGVSLGYIVFMTGRPCWLVRMVEIHLLYNFSNWMWKRSRPKRN